MDGNGGRLFRSRPLPPLTDRPVQSAEGVGMEIPVRTFDPCKVQLFGIQSDACDAVGDEPDPQPLTPRQKSI